MATWTTRQRSKVLIEVCEDGSVIQLEGNGITHLVDFVSGEVLRFLGTGEPRDLKAIGDLIFQLTGGSDLPPEAMAASWLLPLKEADLIEEVV